MTFDGQGPSPTSSTHQLAATNLAPAEIPQATRTSRQSWRKYDAPSSQSAKSSPFSLHDTSLQESASAMKPIADREMNKIKGPVRSEKTTHADIVVREWQKLASRSRPISVDSFNKITPVEVYAVSRNDTKVEVQNLKAAMARVNSSVTTLKERLHDGHSLYGITTGFGGSANTRTQKTFDLQRALLQHQNSGILPVVKVPGSIHASLRHSTSLMFMPEDWVRGAMLVRCKSLLNGHSAIRWDVIAALMSMLNHNLIPLVPLRGSISASGDLSPLSYIAGAIEGNPDIWVWTGNGRGSRDLIPADAALVRIGVQPQIFGPKEGLAVLNGTAFSAAVGALALHEAHHLAVLSQVVTAMGVEALVGAVGSFDPFLAQVRPHKGQIEAAKNITAFLKGSSLARNEDESQNEDRELKQDRYALRTASQWIGPQLEDLILANEQITVECNSTTDNPLLNAEDGTIHHGGNFQAAAVTSAMEKTRLSLQMFGRMIFSQCTELMNPATNNGLPPNLSADDPSTSYTFKGTDINVAAYMSELAYLANPVSSHVQTAEMANQAINSLALVSARYTHQAIDILSMMCAAYLNALCQALDLRVMNANFEEQAVRDLHKVAQDLFGPHLRNESDMQALQKQLMRHLFKELCDTTSKDSGDRFQAVAQALQSTIMTFFSTLDNSRLKVQGFDLLEVLRTFNAQCSRSLHSLFESNREQYFTNPDATPYLGAASKKVYTFIRQDVGVPFHRGLVDHPNSTNRSSTLGTYSSKIYEALRDGRIYSEIVALLSKGPEDVGRVQTGQPGLQWSSVPPAREMKL